MRSSLLISFIKFSSGIPWAPLHDSVQWFTDILHLRIYDWAESSDTQLPCWLISRTRYGEVGLIHFNTDSATLLHQSQCEIAQVETLCSVIMGNGLILKHGISTNVFIKGFHKTWHNLQENKQLCQKKMWHLLYFITKYDFPHWFLVCVKSYTAIKASLILILINDTGELFTGNQRRLRSGFMCIALYLCGHVYGFEHFTVADLFTLLTVSTGKMLDNQLVDSVSSSVYL